MGANHTSTNQQHGDVGNFGLKFFIRKTGLTKGRIIMIGKGKLISYLKIINKNVS